MFLDEVLSKVFPFNISDIRLVGYNSSCKFLSYNFLCPRSLEVCTIGLAFIDQFMFINVGVICFHVHYFWEILGNVALIICRDVETTIMTLNQ